MDNIALALGAGATWSRSVSLARVGRVLENAGLRVSAAKRVTFRKIAVMLSKHHRVGVAIIYLKHLHLAGDRPQHYLILLGSGPKGLCLADPGAYIGWLSMDYLSTHLGPDLGHQCLFVQPGGAPQAVATYALTSPREIVLNIGEIAAGPGMLKVPFLLHNTLKHPIGVGFAKGTCFCFKHATIDTANHGIQPGKTAKIVLSFGRSEIGTGNIVPEVLLSFVGYPHHWLRVLVKCHITAKHPPIQLTWYPQAICLGVVRKPDALGCEEFTVLTPKGISLRSVTVSSKSIRVIPLNNPGGKPEIDEFGRAAHEFVVDLSRLPAGAVNQTVTVETTDKYVPNIVVPITGRIEGRAAASRGQKP
ncbi:MAG: hypothetical protein ACP5VQ_03280 [Phycisphaerae bacterium]